MLIGGRKLPCRSWASELSVFTLSGSDSGVGKFPALLILGKELSWGGGEGAVRRLGPGLVTAQGDKGTQGVWGCTRGWEPQRAVGLFSVPRDKLW